MIKKLLHFIYQYITNPSFRNLCDSALSFSNTVDEFAQQYGAEPRSSNWPKVRNEHLIKDPVCNVCGGKEDLNVHHIVPFHIDKSKELDPTNLITLCNGHGCHFAFGHLYNWQTSNPSVVGDAKLFKKKVEGRV